jgi:hypothetical protein
MLASKTQAHSEVSEVMAKKKRSLEITAPKQLVCQHGGGLTSVIRFTMISTAPARDLTTYACYIFRKAWRL